VQLSLNTVLFPNSTVYYDGLEMAFAGRGRMETKFAVPFLLAWKARLIFRAFLSIVPRPLQFSCHHKYIKHHSSHLRPIPYPLHPPPSLLQSIPKFLILPIRNIRKLDIGFMSHPRFLHNLIPPLVFPNIVCP